MLNTIKNYKINRQESYISLIACLVFLAPSIISLLIGVVRVFIIIPYKLDTIFIYSIFLLIVLIAIRTIFSRVSLLIYSIIYLLLFTYLITFLLNTNYYQYYISLGTTFLFKTIPWLIVGYAVRDYKILKKYLYVSAFIILVSYIMNFLLFKNDLFDGLSYSQGYAYTLLPVAIIFADRLFDRIEFLNVVCFVFSIMLIFSFGARGPLVSVVLYIIVKITLMDKYNLKKKVLYNTVLITIISSILIRFNDIMTYVLSFFQEMNFSVRTIVRLMEGSFFEDNARNMLTKYSIDLISERPIMGVGIGKDRILLANKMGSINLSSEFVGWYPHNIILELLLHFGIFIGGAIIVYIIKILYTITIKNTNKDAIDVICIFMGIGFFPLLFSGSYFESASFFMFIGLCLYQYKRYRLDKKPSK